MNLRRIFLIHGLYASAVIIAAASFIFMSAFSPLNKTSNPFLDDHARKHALLKEAAYSATHRDATRQKLDGFARILLNASSQQRQVSLGKHLDLAVDLDASGQLSADVFIQLDDTSVLSTLTNLGVEVRTQVGDILIARVPLDAFPLLTRESGVRRVEISHKSTAKLDSSRINIGADRVHRGIDLPEAYRGEGVVVGVIDSGIDFTHPDFSDQNGSRIQHLLEFREGGGQQEWTKNEIDMNQANVTQRDGNGEGGHGTHVAGIAVGGGQLNTEMVGVAPAADIIFVKGIREQESFGGYIDTDVVAGTQYIFDKADEMGKPAVVNISIGSHFGPHDGTSLYEQALSSLVAPGNLIVSSAGNEGDDLIHAGDNAAAGMISETIVIADPSDQRAGITMWYDQGIIDAVAVFAYDAEFNFLGEALIGVGNFLDAAPVVVNEDTLGFVTIDAQTTQDPNNGDGNAIIVIDNNDNPSIDISDVIWAVGSQGDSDGRMDLWMVTGGRFYDQEVGFPNETEMPGNNDSSVGIPATAEKIISVGSYVTKTSWFDLDGDSLWISPTPAIADRFPTSSKGPTRDGRMAPAITAPGSIVFSALSSHLTEGIGYQRLLVMQGGGYLGKNGTSMASPHVAGTLALMLQIKNDLTFDEAVQYFSETARTNSFTGVVPNNSVGQGYLDAHAAVKKVAAQATSIARIEDALPGAFELKQNYPNPFNPSTHIEYSLTSDAPTVLKIYNVAGQHIRTLINETQNAGKYTVEWDGTNDTGQRMASGIYYATLNAGQSMQTRKMVLVR